MSDTLEVSTTEPSGGRPDRKLLVIGLVVLVLVVGGLAWAGGRATNGTCDPSGVAKRVMPSVVTIFVKGQSGASGNGSGEFIDRDGHVLTNNHVISPAANGGVITVLRPNGEELTATLVGRDPSTDLAVLKVDPVADAVPVRWGTSPAVGAHVFAIGAPMGLADTFTAGVVSGLNRSVRVPSDNNTTALLVSAIQSDAAINPGNSGGTLADCHGDLVGVPTAGTTANDSLGQAVAGNIGLGFAIPAGTARLIATDLIADGRVDHGDFGVSVVPISSGRSQLTADGLYVAALTAGGPASAAGLRQSDVITELNGQEITSADQLQGIAVTQRAGSTVEVTYVRGQDQHTTTVTLGSSAR